MPESTSLEADPGAHHQIHFAWAEPTLLGRVGPGPAATSLPQQDQPVLRSWRDRLVPALTADYRAALPDTDPAAHPETLWARHYPDGQSALVYRWPGDVREAHAWAIVGPTRSLTFSRILALHENPNTRPAARRPPTPGWATMPTLPAPEPWERTAAPGALRTRDRRAAETRIDDEPILVGALARALEHPDRPIHITLDPDRADLWQAVQMRFLWGLHRTLREVLTPSAALPAAGWHWSFSTYDPVLGTEDGPHLVFGPPAENPAPGSPFLSPTPLDQLRIADGLVTVLREEGGDALAEHLHSRGVPRAATFADRRELLRDWFDPRPRPTAAPHVETPAPVQDLPGLPEDPPGFSEAPPGPSETPPVPLRERAPGQETGNGPEPEDEVEDAGFEDGAGSALAEAPDPFAEDQPQDTSAQEAWTEPAGGFRGVGGRTFLGVARRSPRRALDEEPPEPDVAEPAPVTAGTPLSPRPGTTPETPQHPETPEPSRTHDPRPPGDPESPVLLPQTRTPADAPPLTVLDTPEEDPPDYAAETEPGVGEAAEDPDDNWPTQYVDLPLSRLERWHAKRGPAGAHEDVVDARAAVRAERAELQRVRAERDHYHAEVQELRREIARLDQSWIEAESASDTPERGRRRPVILLALALLVVVFAAGLEVGARTDQGVLELLAGLARPLTSSG
ncbi:hypothetical protein ACWFMI_05885 [Nocardiopsis terrae]